MAEDTTLPLSEGVCVCAHPDSKQKIRNGHLRSRSFIELIASVSAGTLWGFGGVCSAPAHPEGGLEFT